MKSCIVKLTSHLPGLRSHRSKCRHILRRQPFSPHLSAGFGLHVHLVVNMGKTAYWKENNCINWKASQLHLDCLQKNKSLIEKENMSFDTIFHNLLVCLFFLEFCVLGSTYTSLPGEHLPGIFTPGMNEFEQKSWRILTLWSQSADLKEIKIRTNATWGYLNPLSLTKTSL